MTSNNDNSELLFKQAAQLHKAEFYALLNYVENVGRNKLLGQKAFTRAILAAVEKDIAPSEKLFKFETEQEVQFAICLEKLFDLRFILKQNKLKEEDKLNETKENTNVTG